MAKNKSHWLDELTTRWIGKRGTDNHVVCTGKSPSGPINIGFLRELILGDAIRRSLSKQGAQAKLVLVVDEFDPMRDKKYAFLPDDFDYDKYVGVPLCLIPDPFGEYENYAERYLDTLLRAMDKLGIEAEVVRASHMYAAGKYGDLITIAMEKIDTIVQIIKDASGREVDADWLPLSAVCEKSQKLVRCKRGDLDLANDRVRYQDADGEEGYAYFHKGQTKLDWRVDWAARWVMLGTTAEPFGKDHSSRGGSYDTGRAIVQQVFDSVCPEPVVYEWIELKGQGAMSTSKGVGVSLEQMIDAVPADIIRYLVLASRPNKVIQFDPFMGMMQVFEKFEGLANRYHGAEPPLKESDQRIFELSCANDKDIEKKPLGVSWRHLLTLLQISAGDTERLRRALIRAGYESDLERWDEIMQRVEYGRKWLDTFADESVKTTLHEDSAPKEAEALSDEQRQLLLELAKVLEGGADENEIHNAIYELMKPLGLDAGKAFAAIYLAFLGKHKGPRAGWFLHSLDPAFAVGRMRELAQENVS
jgi:lysyl-tRNA synthetase, class I